MFRNRYFIPFVTVLILVAFLNWLGGAANYYWTTDWFDWVVHFLGGTWVALAVLFIGETRLGSKYLPRVSVKTIFFVALSIGVLWEIYELTFTITNFHDIGYTWDTTHDILMDISGALVTAFTFRKNFAVKISQENLQ